MQQESLIEEHQNTLTEANNTKTISTQEEGHGYSEEDLYGDIPNLYLTLGYILESTTELASAFNTTVSSSIESMQEISAHTVRKQPQNCNIIFE